MYEVGKERETYRSYLYLYDLPWDTLEREELNELR